jgi:DNA-binding transcriptional LysR family regulator
LELSSNNAVKLAVEEGLGIGVISRNIATDEIKAGKLIAIPFSDPDMKHKYYMVHHKDKYISDILQHLINTADQWAVEYKKSLP